MTFVNRLIALVLGVTLGALGILVAIEAVIGLADRPPRVLPLERLDAELETVAWSDPFFRWVGIGMIVVGALLVAAQFVPRKPPSYVVVTERDDRAVSLGRRGLQSHLADVVRAQDGVVDAEVHARRRRVWVRAKVPAAARARENGVQGRVESALSDELGQLDLRRPLKVRVRVGVGERRVQ